VTGSIHTHTHTHNRHTPLPTASELTVNGTLLAAARFCSANFFSMGTKSTGTDAVAKSSREIQNRRGAARGRGRRSRARASPGPVDFFSRGTKNLTAPTTSPRARARYRIGGPEVAAADLNQGREIQNLGLKVPRGAQGCRLCCCCCCCMQKSSAPFFFSFRRFLFCTLVEVRYWPKENVITSSVGGARLLQDAHADEIGA
jgi:hypothetical protein